MTFVQTIAGDWEIVRHDGPACAALLNPRILIEMAAERDPDTYVPILDALDSDTMDLEDDEIEPQPVECWFDPVGYSPWVPVYEQCPCCGNREHHGEFTQ